VIELMLDGTVIGGYTSVDYPIRRRTGPQSRPVLERPPTAPTHLLPWTTETRESGSGYSPTERLSALQITSQGAPALTKKENRDGSLPSDDRHPATPQGRVRLPQRLLDNRAMESGRRRGGAFERSAGRRGAEFRLVAEFLGRKNELTDRIVEYDPPRAVTFSWREHHVVSRDRITVDSATAGTRVTYDADLALKGPLRIADPVLRFAFSRVGDRALGGLTRTFAPSPPQTLSPLAGRALNGKRYELPRDLANG
jgi:Polyketide cyclase / dehydrase and lipid transport